MAVRGGVKPIQPPINFRVDLELCRCVNVHRGRYRRASVTSIGDTVGQEAPLGHVPNRNSRQTIPTAVSGCRSWAQIDTELCRDLLDERLVLNRHTAMPAGQVTLERIVFRWRTEIDVAQGLPSGR